jgi:undecaprenyl-diphosphatase
MIVGAVVTGITAVVLVVRRRRVEALFWVLAVGGVVVLDLPLKQAFRRASIGNTAGFSFPSGNAMASVAILAAFALTCPARLRTWTLAVGIPLVFVYGVALVYQLWHYPSDVVAGWCAALVWVMPLWFGLRRATEPGV